MEGSHRHRKIGGDVYPDAALVNGKLVQSFELDDVRRAGVRWSARGREYVREPWLAPILARAPMVPADQEADLEWGRNEDGSDEPTDQHGARADDVLNLTAKIDWLMILWFRLGFYIEERNEIALFWKEQIDWLIDNGRKKWKSNTDYTD